MARPGRYADGGGLYLQVREVGTKAWLFRFMLDGRARAMGLGPVNDVPLTEARELAQNCRRLLRDGVDPIEARRAKRLQGRLEAAKAITFRECAEKLIASQEAAWRNSKHRQQWRNTLATYADPVLGGLSVAAVDTALVLKVIEPIWTKKPETAGRLRGRIEHVLDWAKAQEYRRGDNPARWRGHLDKLLPRRSKVARVKHHTALPYGEAPTFMHEVRVRTEVSARALEFTILTAARTGETIGARWPEIDFKTKTWIVPPDRMKGGREHRVPLSDRAIEILENLPRKGEYVFPGGQAKEPLSNGAMLATLDRMERGDVTVHGFRSSFRDWAAEQTSYPNHVVEMALAHAIKSDVEASYRRGDLFEKRRRLMRDWTKFCSALATEARKVIPLRAAR
jgi:integrase